MKTILVLFSFVLVGGIASAQTATDEREPASWAPAPGGPQRGRRATTSEEDKILARGPISHGNYIAGGVTGSIVGFGIGHAIQGRYGSRGWIFTATEIASIALLVSSADCRETTYNGTTSRTCESNLVTAMAGIVGLIGFHVWEIVDLWVTPPRINRRYEEISGRRKVSMQMTPVLLAGERAETAPGLGLKLTF